MAIVYILYSGKIDRFYTGSALDMAARLEDHLHKKFVGGFTTKAQDWKVFFVINDLSYEQARKIEVHLKNMKSRKYFNDLKQYPAIVIRLKELYK